MKWQSGQILSSLYIDWTMGKQRGAVVAKIVESTETIITSSSIWNPYQKRGSHPI
jgi:hypothetical protein